MNPRDLFHSLRDHWLKIKFGEHFSFGGCQIRFLSLECSSTFTSAFVKITFGEYNYIIPPSLSYVQTILYTYSPSSQFSLLSLLLHICIFIICLDVRKTCLLKNGVFSARCEYTEDNLDLESVSVRHLWKKGLWELMLSWQKSPIFNTIYKRNLITTQVLMLISHPAIHAQRCRYL